MSLHSSLLLTPFVPVIFQSRLLDAAYVSGSADTLQKAIRGRKLMSLLLHVKQVSRVAKLSVGQWRCGR